MATHRLQRNQWQSYFDGVSRLLEGRQAEIEVAGLGIGAQREKAWTALNGLAYDPKDDVFEVATDEVDHLIEGPKEILVEDSGSMLTSVEVVDADDNHQIIRLREPIALPAH